MNQAPHLRHRSALEAYYFALVVFISLLSLISIALLSVESFSPGLVLLGALASLSPAIFVLKKYPSSKRLNRSEWLVIALVVGAFALRCNTSVHVYGGQDPGVYTNIASYFARHGTWIVKDRLLDEFEGRADLRDYYLTNSIRRTARNEHGGWYGNMLPGIYVKDRDENEWVSQFYHVNTTWLAIGQWIFGMEWKGLTLALLSSLTIIAAYLITTTVSLSPVAGIIAAFLLATNAAHSYMGTFPVSEAVAGFFFLSALSMLTAGWQLTSILPFCALFLTRITGFLTAPLILIALAWMVVKRRDSRAAWTGLGILAAYGVSVMWGLHFSGPYSRDIYRGKIGIPTDLLAYAPSMFLVVGMAWMIMCFLALRGRKILKPLCALLLRYRNPLIVVAIALVIVAIGFRGYLLGFTEHYAQHRWFARRWNMAGHGVESLKYLSVYSLTIMVSPLGLLAFLAGLAHVGKLAITRAKFAPLAVCALGFFAALTIKQLTTPYLYYFGRYLVSELLPLAIVSSAIAIHTLTRGLPRFQTTAIVAYPLCIFILLYPSLRARLHIREGSDFFDAMSCVSEATAGQSVILIDKKSIAETPIVTALRFSFGKPTFALREEDFSQPGKLTDLITFFQSKGFEVYLLSTSDSWQSKEGLNKVIKIPTIMRRIMSKASPPTKIGSNGISLRLYSLQTPQTIPDICERVKHYKK